MRYAAFHAASAPSTPDTLQPTADCVTTTIAPSPPADPALPVTDAGLEHSHRIANLRGKTVAATAWTMGGHGAQQVLRLGGNLILTRLLTADVFGLMTLVQVSIRAVSFFSDLGVNQSIIRDKRGDDRRFLDTSWTIQIIRGNVIWLLAALAAWPASLIYDTPELLYLIPISALSAIIAGFNSTKLATLNRRLALGRLTLLDTLTQAAGLMVMVGIALYSPTVWALIAGGFVSSIGKLWISHYVLPGDRNRFCWHRESVQELVRFGRWVAVSTACAFLLQQGDKLIMGALVDRSTLGVYAVAYLLSQAVLEAQRTLGPRVLLPVYTQLLHHPTPTLRRKVLKLRIILLLLFVTPLLVMTLWGQQIVKALYTEPYHDAGWMLQILAAGNIGSAINLSAGGVVLASGDSFRYMILQVSRGVMMIAGMAIGFAFGGPIGLLVGMGASYWLNYPFLVWAIRRHGVWLPGLDAAVFAFSTVVAAIAYTLR